MPATLEPLDPTIKTDLAVIGAGFWGVAIATEAKKRGIGVVLFDDARPDSGSRNAAGLVQRGWFREPTSTTKPGIINRLTPKRWGLCSVDEGLAWLAINANLRQTGEVYSSYLGPKVTVRPDLYLVYPETILGLAGSIPQIHVTSVVQRAPDRVFVHTDRTSTFAVRAVVIAAGVWTDELLRASNLPPVGVSRLRGRAILARTPKPVPTPVTRLIRPYVSYTLRPWADGLARIGDTVERSERDGAKQAADLNKTLQEVAPGSEIVRWFDGYRPVAPEFVVDSVIGSSRIVVATGAHRVGLIMAGIVAKRAVDLVEKGMGS